MKKSLCIIALDKMLSNTPITLKDDKDDDYRKGEFIIECINSNETVNLNGKYFIEEVCITELELI